MTKPASLLLALCLAGCSTVIVEPDPDGPVDERPEPSEWTSVSDEGIIGPRDVLLAPDGSTIVFGMALRDDSTACAFERFDAEGRSLGATARATTVAGHPFTSAQAATLGPHGEIVLLCLATLEDGSTASWLGWHEASGAFIRETEIPGLVGYDLVHAWDVEDEVIVVGSDHRMPEYGVVAVHERVSIWGPTDHRLWEGSSVPGNVSAAVSIARHPDGWTAVTKLETDPTGAVVEAKLAKLDGGLGVQWPGEPCGAHVAIGPDGSIFTAESAVDGRSAVICRHTHAADGTWPVEVVDVDIPDATYVGITGIATDGLENVVVNGFVYPTDASVSAEMFARAYGPQGNVLWHDAYRGEDGLFGFGMAVAADAERVVHAGLVTGSGTYPYKLAVRTVTP